MVYYMLRTFRIRLSWETRVNKWTARWVVCLLGSDQSRSGAAYSVFSNTHREPSGLLGWPGDLGSKSLTSRMSPSVGSGLGSSLMNQCVSGPEGPSYGWVRISNFAKQNAPQLMHNESSGSLHIVHFWIMKSSWEAIFSQWTQRNSADVVWAYAVARKFLELDNRTQSSWIDSDYTGERFGSCMPQVYRWLENSADEVVDLVHYKDSCTYVDVVHPDRLPTSIHLVVLERLRNTD